MATRDEILSIGVDLDVKKAIGDSAKLQRALLKHVEKIGKGVKTTAASSSKSSQEAAESMKSWSKATGETAKKQKNLIGEISELEKGVERLREQAASANEEELDDIQKKIRGLEKLAKVKKGSVKHAILDGEAISKFKSEIKDIGDNFKSSIKDSAQEFKGSISSFFQKDLKGIISGLGKGVTTPLGGFIQRGAKKAELAKELGVKNISKKRMNAMGPEGAALKELSKFSGKMGGVLSTLSKLGPIMTMAGSAFMAVVTLLIDAEAKAKEFQKDILQSASNTEFLAAAGGDANLAFDDMKDTIHGIRNAAFSLENIKWGITAEEHKAVIGTLNQEGVSLQRIGQEAKRAGQDVETFAGSLTHTGVTYSRAFGVPLQEVAQLQSEMMSELAMGAGQTKFAFEQMNRAAADSGISATKFFAMIRGVSQDLSLWSNRMEDAVKLLNRLGKVMNPREAQKFFSIAQQGYKNMGRSERLRVTLLADSKKKGIMKDSVDYDTKRRAKGLSSKLGMSADDLIKQVKKGGAVSLDVVLQEKLDKGEIVKEEMGTIKGALIDMQLQMTRASKGTFGVSGAARNLGPGGWLDTLNAATLSLTGKKSLAEGVGDLGVEMMAENLNMSEEQLDQSVKMIASLEYQREVLKKQLMSGDATQVDLARKALLNADIQADSEEELLKKVNETGYAQIIDTLDENTQKEMKEAHEGKSAAETLAEKQAELSSSALDKLGALVDFVTNQLYNIIVEVLGTVEGIRGIMSGDIGKDSSSRRLIKNKAITSKDPMLIKAVEDANSGSDAGDFVAKFRKSFIEGGLGKQLAETISNYKKGGEGSADSRISLQSVERAINTSMENDAKGKGKKVVVDTLRASGITDDKQIQAVLEGLSDKSFTGAMSSAGIDKDKMMEVFQKSLWFMDPNLLGNVSSALKPKTESLTPDKSKPVDVPPQKIPPSVPAVVTPVNPQKIPTQVGSGVATASPASVPRGELESIGISQDQLSEMQLVAQRMNKIKMDTSFVKGPFATEMERSVLDALRVALFEYYMYSEETDRSKVVNFMSKEGMGAKDFAKFTTDQVALKKTIPDAVKGNAAGGLVTGVGGGLATVTAAAGEGLASVGKGERIVPAGGGGGGSNISIAVNGVGGQDLAKLIEGKVVEGIYEYKRRERLT